MSNFQDLNTQNYFKKNPQEKTEDLWYKLLNYLQEEPENMVKNSDSGDEGTPFNFIQSHIDLPETTLEASGFFDSIYQDLIDSLPFDSSIFGYYNIDDLDNWKSYYWNESVSKMVQLFYCSSDKRGIASYERNFLYETEDGKIDTLRLQGGIKTGNGNDLVDLRTIDINESDAGNSFVREEDIYEYQEYITGYELTITCYTKEQNGQVYPCTPITFVLDKQEILEKIPDKYSEIFKSNGTLWADIVDRLNLTGSYAPGGENEGKGWEGWNILNRLYEAFHIEKLNQHKGDIYAFEAFLREKDEHGTSFRHHQFFRGRGEEKTIKLKKVVNPWVIPWYNAQGLTYKYTRAADLKKSVMNNGENQVSTDGSRSFVFNKFLDFTHSHFGHNYSGDFKWLYNRLLMPEYKRKVEIEDLNRNFWTIGQTMTALSNYILGDGGFYGKTIGNILNEIMQLWENVLFLWGQIAIQSQKKPDIHAEVVYISPEELSDELGYDFNFDYNDDSIIEQIVDNHGNIRSIHRFEENSILLTQVIRYLRKYRLKYADYNVSLYPVVRLNNYKDNYYSRLILLGEYKYCYNYKDMVIKVEDSTSQTGESDPEGEIRSIDGQDIFYTNFYLKLPKQKDYHHCQFKESFFSYSQEEDFTGEYKFYYIADVDARDYIDYIYGISENGNEEDYSGCVPLSSSISMQTGGGEKAWGLISFDTEINISYLTNKIVWTTYLKCYGKDVAKIFLNNRRRNALNQNFILYSFEYSYDALPPKQYVWKDSRRDLDLVIEDFKQIQPVNNEFGYYKGELLTTSQPTSPAQFNIIDFGERRLPPSDFNEDSQGRNYPACYGENYSGNEYNSINQDVIDDEIILTNYLRNIYDYWNISGNDKTIFWDTRQDKIKLPNTIWNADYEARVGYGMKDNGERTGQVLRKRSTVEQSRDNKNKVWDNWNEEGYNKWKRDAENMLKRDGEDIASKDPQFLTKIVSPSTILFVSGSRDYNFYPRTGNNIIGNDILAKDGLLHHQWNCDGTQHTRVGAAVKIPVPNVGAVYSFYPKHAEPSETENGIYKVWLNYHKVIVRDGSKKITFGALGEKYPTYEPNWIFSGVNERNEDVYNRNCMKENIDFRTLPIKTKRKQNEEEYVDNFKQMGFTGTGDNKVFLIMRKKDDTVFTHKNWLINHLVVRNSQGTVYFNGDTSDIDDNRKNNTKIDISGDTNKKKLNGRFSVYFGKEESVNVLSTAYYYEWAYQRYIYNKIQEENPNKTVDELLREKTILNVLYTENAGNNNALYIDEIKETLMGWLKIETQSQTYNIKIKEPLYYSSFENKDIIEKIRENGSINRTINGNNGKEIIKQFLKIIDATYWDNTKPSDSDIDNIIDNLETIDGNVGSPTIKCYGLFNKHYDVEVNREYSETMWYEDRIMLCERSNEYFKDQDILFNSLQEDSPQTYGAGWISRARQILDRHKYFYQRNSLVESIQVLEEFIQPLEGQLPSAYYFNLPIYEDPNDANNNVEIQITDRFYFMSTTNTYFDNYVFGPNQLYARRRIYKYTDYHDLSPVPEIGDKKGKWVERPSTPTISTDLSCGWRDDYDKFNATVDDLRRGYRVIQTISSKDMEKVELYKTNFNQTADSTAIVQAAQDDLDYYDNIPNGWIYSDGQSEPPHRGE